MALAEQFDLLELIQRDKAETWLAVEKTSKRRLLLHSFREDTGLRQRLLAMGPEDLIMLVAAEREGEYYVVVTHDQPPLRQFATWVRERSDNVASKETVRTPLPKPAPKAAEEPFDPDRTQLMSPKIGGPSASKIDAMPPVANEPPRSEPGEFTRLFQVPPAASSEQPAKSGTTGDFTRLFGPLNGFEKTSAPDKKPAPKEEPGEFTKLFYAPPKPVTDPGHTPIPPPAKPKVNAEGPGEFTRVFDNPFSTPASEPERTLYREPLPPPATAPPKRAEGEFTRVFGQSSQATEVPLPKFDGGHATGIFEPPPRSGSALNATPPSAGTGYDTRLFQTPPPSPPTAAPPAETAKPKDDDKPPQPAVAQKNVVVLVIVLAVLAIAAVSLLLYFVLRR